MILKRLLKLILVLTVIFIPIYYKFYKDTESSALPTNEENIDSNSNIIENVSYTTKDGKGNEYLINAFKAEIDFSAPNILYLTKVDALVKLNNSEDILITSDYGKYNSENFDTIFSKNVIIKYLDNKITGEYLDFSIKRDSLIMTRNIVYTNIENILQADVLELDIDTKNTKIYMYETENKVNIKPIK